MSLTGSRDGERGSYPEIVDALTRHGAQAKTDAHALYRGVVFNVLISNVDDHLRNHGFVRDPRLAGWRLSPLYDVVPRPGVAYERFLHLEVGLQGKLATLDNALSAYARFDLERQDAVMVMATIVHQVQQWRGFFEGHGASGALIDRLSTAFRELEEVASPSLRKELTSK